MTEVTHARFSGPTTIDLAAPDAFSDGAPLLGDASVETFRTLALGVQHLMATSSPWAIAVVGAQADGGHRLIVAEMLARALGELRPPVRLVEADPGSPVRPREHVAADGPGFSVVPLGRMVAPGPQSVLRAVQRTVDEELSAGHSVVIDAPPADESSLAFSLAQLANATIYVARTGARASGIHLQVREQLDLLGVRVLGVVVEQG